MRTWNSSYTGTRDRDRPGRRASDYYKYFSDRRRDDWGARYVTVAQVHWQAV